MNSQLTLQRNSQKAELLKTCYQDYSHSLQIKNSNCSGVCKNSLTAASVAARSISTVPVYMSDHSGGSVSCDSPSPQRLISLVLPEEEDVEPEPSIDIVLPNESSHFVINAPNVSGAPRTPRINAHKRRAEELFGNGNISVIRDSGNRHRRNDEYLIPRDLASSPIRPSVAPLTYSAPKSPSPALLNNEDSNSSQNSCGEVAVESRVSGGVSTNNVLNSGRPRAKRKKVTSGCGGYLNANGSVVTIQRNSEKCQSFSTSFQSSPVRNYNSTSNSSASNQEWAVFDRSIQTDLSIMHIQQLEESSTGIRDEAKKLEFQRQVSDMDKRITAQQKLIHQLRDHQEKSKEMIKKLLIEKADLERKATRQKCMENRLRLGQFQTIRHGSHLEEKWLDGFAFQQIEKRKQEIEAERDRIEKDKKNWQKRKPGSAKSSAAAKREDVDNMTAEEFFVQLEIYEQRRMSLLKEEKELKEEQEKLDRERNLHIRELKRIQNEDSSRFRDHIILNQRYLLLCLLGKGGFSEVHMGYDLTEQRYTACKIHQLNPNWPKDKKENYIRHAVREIAIHKTLVHSRIVRVFDVFDIDPDSFCTVLEYNRGNDLDFYLKQNKALSEREGKNIITQVVSALKYLNQRKPPVIHYDLKPGNILLGSNEGAGEIKITDFGLSKLMEEDTYNPELGMELTSQGAGTYWYLPPECFETGSQLPRISSKVDVWSVGVIFFQCLYGRKPFGHNQSQADILQNNTILQARTIEFPVTAPGNSKVSDQAKKFIQRCCTYNKNHRPDVFQLAEDDYLKSKAQLKSVVSTASTGLFGMPPPFPLDGLYLNGDASAAECAATAATQVSAASSSTLNDVQASPTSQNQQRPGIHQRIS